MHCEQPLKGQKDQGEQQQPKAEPCHADQERQNVLRVQEVRQGRSTCLSVSSGTLDVPEYRPNDALRPNAVIQAFARASTPNDQAKAKEGSAEEH